MGSVRTPAEFKYTKDHEWIRIDGDSVRLGITDYAQDALGDVVFVQLPDVGTAVVLHQGIAEIESTKSVNDVYAPVSGTISQVNQALVASPELLNSDPYGEGWICEISGATLDETVLLTAEQYEALVGA